MVKKIVRAIANRFVKMPQIRKDVQRVKHTMHAFKKLGDIDFKKHAKRTLSRAAHGALRGALHGAVSSMR